MRPLPELTEPQALVTVRPWVDVGRVGRHTLMRLERHLDAQEFARAARPGHFYDLSRYRPRVMNVGTERRITIPNTTVLYAKRDQAPDILFFHLLEPHAFGEDYVDSVLELLKHFQVSRYIQIGGVSDAVPHTRPLLATGFVPEEVGKKFEIQQSNYQGPTSITSLIGIEAAKIGIEAMTFLVRLPHYAQLDEDYAGVARLTQILCEMYDLPGHLVDSERGQRQYQQIDTALTRNPQARKLVEQLEASYDAAAQERTEGEYQCAGPRSGELPEGDERAHGGRAGVGRAVQQNRVKKVMMEGKLALGSYVSFADPAVIEIIGLAGFDAAFIDMEHTSFDLNLVEQMIRAADLARVTSVIRVPDNDAKLILRILEMGGQGIIVPHVDGVEGARKAVDAVRYAPMGQRGGAGSTRAAGYGSVPWREHVQTSNQEVMLSLMLEDEKGLEDAEQIAALEGVDLVALGPTDLSETLGVTDPKDPRLRQKVEEIAAIVRRVGKAKLSIPVNHAAMPLTPQDLMDLGVGYTHVGPSPVAAVLNALKESVKRVREQTGQPVRV